MGKVLRLTWELNRLLSCFGLLALYLHINVMQKVTQPAGLHGIPQPWYWHSTARQWKVQLDKRHVGPPPFSHLAVLFINAYTLIFIIFIIIWILFKPK